MNEPIHREIALLNAALERPAEQRAAFLEDACAGDEALRLQVMSLIEAHERAQGFLEAPLMGLVRGVKITEFCDEQAVSARDRRGRSSREVPLEAVQNTKVV